jgi:hypothetical protein
MPREIHKFENSAVLGRKGEAIVAKTLSRNGINFFSAVDEKVMQGQDIDFVLVGHKWGSVEVKADRYRDNFFIETISNVLEEVPGWLEKTRADVIAYCFVELGITYWLPVPELRQVMSANGESWLRYRKEVSNRDSFRQNSPTEIRHTIGYAIPREVLVEALKAIGCAPGLTQNPEIEEFPTVEFEREYEDVVAAQTEIDPAEAPDIIFRDGIAMRIL